MVGILGIGSGGKTTLATSFFIRYFADFDGRCFVENIREKSRKHGLKSLQEHIISTIFNTQMQVKSMLCSRNVLIVLDDVGHLEQIKALAGYHNWFGDGSRITITTRDGQVPKSHRVDEVCHVNLLSDVEAVRLFNMHAYNEKKPLQDYEMLSQKIVNYAAGLPVSLIVLGSFLYKKDKDEWLSTLDRLKLHPEDILKKLKIS